MITIETNADEVAGQFISSAWRARGRTASVLQAYSMHMQRQIRALAPYKTGEYRASIGRQFFQAGGSSGFEIGSDLPRGYILEFGGFVEQADGTVHRRTPQPHFRPVMAEAEERIRFDVATAVAYP